MVLDWETVLYEGEELESTVIDSWRWGSVHRRVFKWEGKTLAVEYRVQPEHGVQEFGPPEPYEVVEEIQTKKVYVRKK